LNKYLGGGEVLALRFAEYLHKTSHNYTLLIHNDDNCYIKNQASEKKINYLIWPSNNDSVVYMNSSERLKLQSKIAELLTCKDYFVFTFCFRDLYNSLYFFSRLKGKNIKYCTGIYHPEDVFYLSSLTFNKSKIIDFNRGLATAFNAKNAIVFANETAKSKSCNLLNLDSKQNIFPIPININNLVIKKKTINNKQLRIVSISRFVDFKIGAVFAIIKFIRNNKNFHLDLIGYGPFEIPIRLYLIIHKIKNITLYGKVNPDDLHGIIKEGDLGYAQGTSILEIAKYGLPVVIAPYSRIKDMFNNNFNCMGVFGEKDNFNYGDIIDDGSDNFVSLDHAIFKIVANYDEYCKISINHLQKFDSVNIFKSIVSLIISSDYSQETPFVPHEPAIFKKLLMRYKF
jgi:hypothetical protein